MRQKKYFGIIIFLFVVTLISTVSFFKKPPEKLIILNSLPKPDNMKPQSYLLLLARGEHLRSSSFDPVISRWLKKIFSSDDVYYLLKLGCYSQDLALLTTMNDKSVSLYLSLRLSRRNIYALEHKRLPETWGNFLGDVKITQHDEGNFNYWTLSGGNLKNNLYLTVYGGQVLISTKVFSIRKMIDTLMGRSEPFSPIWELEPDWTGHFRINDVNITETGRPVILNGAWDKKETSGTFKWTVEGISCDERMSQSFKWNTPFLLPKPLGVAIGFNFVSFMKDIKISGQPFSKFFEQIYRFICKYPVVISLGGISDVITLPMSGVLLNVFNISTEDKKELFPPVLNEFTPSSDLKSAPFSFFFNESADTTAIGIVEESSLYEHDLSSKVFFSDIWKNSLAWGYIDCNAVSVFLDNTMKLGRIVSQGENIYLKNILPSLKSAGFFTFIIKDINSGVIKWEKVKENQFYK